jgi:hypothetical protein
MWCLMFETHVALSHHTKDVIDLIIIQQACVMTGKKIREIGW